MASKGKIAKAAISPGPETISYQVKYAILLVYGITKPRPDSLADNALLANFNFNDYQWMELAGELSEIVKTFQPGHTVSVTTLENLVTVRDCIHLVMEKIK